MQAGTYKNMDPVVDQECVPPKKRRNYGMKRKCISASSSKKAKLDEDQKSAIQLVLLPEDVLLEILKNCDHYALAQIRTTCPLFERLVQDYTLWREVRFVGKAAQWPDLYFIYNNVNSNTKVLKVLGNESNILPSNWVRRMCQKCPHLEHISFPYQVLDASTVTINVFPVTVTSLDLSKTTLQRLPLEQSYFKDICNFLPNLKYLNLSHCIWFEPHSLMAISKSTKLEVLLLQNCPLVRDCLAYCGLSTRAGFPALRTLDLRRCAISNSELMCFSSIKTLKNLYLENVAGAPTVIDQAIKAMCSFQPNNGGELIQKIQLERLIVRNYRLSSTTIMRLAEDATTLKYLDITGADETDIVYFKNVRPNVTLVI